MMGESSSPQHINLPQSPFGKENNKFFDCMGTHTSAKTPTSPKTSHRR